MPAEGSSDNHDDGQNHHDFYIQARFRFVDGSRLVAFRHTGSITRDQSYKKLEIGFQY